MSRLCRTLVNLCIPTVIPAGSKFKVEKVRAGVGPKSVMDCDWCLLCGRKGKVTGTCQEYITTSPYQPLTQENGFKIIQLQMVFRHGARTPINFTRGLEEAVYDVSLSEDLPEVDFPVLVVNCFDGEKAQESELEPDLRNKTLAGGCRASVLTSVGQKQMLSLGQTIGQNYLSELGIQGYSADLFRLRTTNLERTIKSLKCVLAGMFGTEHLNTVGPILFPVKSIHEEDLFPNKISCPALRLAVDMALTTIASSTTIRNDKLAVLKALKQPSDVYLDFGCLRDDVACRVAHGMEYPNRLLPFQKMIEEHASKTIHSVYAGKISCGRERHNVTKFAIGRLLYSIVSEMDSAAQGVKAARLCLYSAHDTTIAPMLDALGIWTNFWPPFAANIVFELYLRNDDNKPYVRVLYNGESMLIRGHNKAIVSFDEFKEALEPNMIDPATYSKACSQQRVSQQFVI